MKESILLYISNLSGLVAINCCGSGDKMFLIYDVTSRNHG